MTQALRIFAAMRGGAETSREIAVVAGSGRANISVVLCGLAELGLIERAGVANSGKLGRPYVRWRLRSGGMRTS